MIIICCRRHQWFKWTTETKCQSKVSQLKSHVVGSFNKRIILTEKNDNKKNCYTNVIQPSSHWVHLQFIIPFHVFGLKLIFIRCWSGSIVFLLWYAWKIFRIWLHITSHSTQSLSIIWRMWKESKLFCFYICWESDFFLLNHFRSLSIKSPNILHGISPPLLCCITHIPAIPMSLQCVASSLWIVWWT